MFLETFQAQAQLMFGNEHLEVVGSLEKYRTSQFARSLIFQESLADMTSCPNAWKYISRFMVKFASETPFESHLKRAHSLANNFAGEKEGGEPLQQRRRPTVCLPLSLESALRRLP